MKSRCDRTVFPVDRQGRSPYVPRDFEANTSPGNDWIFSMHPGLLFGNRSRNARMGR
jgi:hypothetical protein